MTDRKEHQRPGTSQKPVEAMPDRSERRHEDAWLARPETIRLLWWVFSAVLALSVAAQLLFKVKGYFGVDGWLGFGAIYGFISCLAMVLVAKVLGWLLKRKTGYYLGRQDD